MSANKFELFDPPRMRHDGRALRRYFFVFARICYLPLLVVLAVVPTFLGGQVLYAMALDYRKSEYFIVLGPVICAIVILGCAVKWTCWTRLPAFPLPERFLFGLIGYAAYAWAIALLCYIPVTLLVMKIISILLPH